MRQEGKSVIFKDIEMGPTAFERESFVPVCTSKGSEILYIGIAQKLNCVVSPNPLRYKRK